MGNAIDGITSSLNQTKLGPYIKFLLKSFGVSDTIVNAIIYSQGSANEAVDPERQEIIYQSWSALTVFFKAMTASPHQTETLMETAQEVF